MSDYDLNKIENIFVDIDRRCRTCLGICAEFNDLSKYVEIGGCKMSLVELISRCASVQISEQDGLPQRICETCKDTAVKSHLFKIQCETSEKYLESISNKTEFETLHTSYFEETANNIITEFKIEKTFISTFEADEKKTSCNILTVAENFSTENQNDNSCNFSDTTGDEEIIHIQPAKEKEKYICYSCNEIFSTKKCLNKHLKIQLYKCATCEFTFHDVNEYTTHRNQHRTDPDRECLKGRTCTYCDKVFQYRTSMLKHQRKHNAPPKTCSYCSFKPTSPSVLSKHMEQMHAHLKTFNCSVCNKAFFKKANLRLHVQVHSGVKKHTCEICGVSFVLRGNLSVHRRLHTGERPYTCSVCGRGFTQQSALRSHEAGHSDKKDHVCPECGAAFSRAGALRNHRKRHSSSKPFECSICGKKFTFSSERKRHMLIHSGDKNHECEVCGKRFSRNANLKVHRRIHTGETPHVCGVCGKGFIQAHCLRTHMNTHASKAADSLVQ